MTRKQRVTRVVYGIYVVIVAAFVVSNIAQVGFALFGPNGGAATAESAKVGAECAKAIQTQVGAIEQALTASTVEKTAEGAKSRYVTDRDAKRSDEVQRACASDPHGVDAIAALERLDRAAASQAFRTASDLSPVRLSTQSFISGPQ